MQLLQQKVLAFAHKHALWEHGDIIVLACSGGPDSLALADMLCRLRESEGLQLVLAHFEHGIRGEASLADAAFVRDYAKQHDIIFRLGAADVPALAQKSDQSLETAARECRYRFLRQVTAEFGGALLATAHHADDQAETVLMRVLRGTGITGLAAMQARQGKLIRPLLSIRKQELEAYCRENGLVPRRDVTNEEPLYLRNRLRLDLLPQLQKEYNPELTNALVQLAEIAAGVEKHLAAEAQAAAEEMAVRQKNGWCLSREKFSEISDALQMYVLRYLLQMMDAEKNVGYVHLRHLQKLICTGHTGASCSLPQEVSLKISYGQAELIRQSKAVQQEEKIWERDLQVPGITELPWLGLRIKAEFLKEKIPEYTKKKIVVDAEKLPPPYKVRNRRKGDSFALQQGRQRVKDFFINSKLPRELRDRIPIFTAKGEIFWLGGLRQAYLAWTDAQTEKYLCFAIEKM